jgi:rhodanese-related sulfurtransferase
VSEVRRALRQAAALAGLSVVVAAALHVPLIGRFVRGEFRKSFFQAAEYPGLRLIGLEEAEDLWRTGAALVLDARAAGPFAEGHVPGARNVPAGEAEAPLPGSLAGTPPGRAVLVYCEGGDCRSSLVLAKRLHGAGFTDVRVFEGGWAAWSGAGLPVEAGRDGAPEGGIGR